MDPLNSLAYYLKSLTYFTKKDINNAIMSFKKYTESLDSDDILAKAQLFYLEYLLNQNSSKDLNYKILTKINQVPNIKDGRLLYLIRCKIHIELKMYYEAKLCLDTLYKSFNDYEYITYIYLLQEYSDFWSYICEVDKINNNDFTKLGIVNEFSKYMYKSKEIFKFINLLYQS